MARMDAMTMKMDAQYKELQSRLNNSNSDCNDDDIPMSREEEAKFMKTFSRTRFYNYYRDRDLNRDNWRSCGRNDYNRDNYRSNSNNKHYDIQRQLSDFIKAPQSTNAFVKKTFMELKTKLETTTKNHQASIQNLEAKFDRLVDKQYAQPSGSLPSSTQPNPKGSSSKPYQPPQARNEHDEEEESTPQPKSQTPKPVKKTLIPKPYKPKITYPQCLRKEKIKAQYGKFLDMIRAVQINVPLVDDLAGMPNYGKFLKELVSNKHKLEQILSAFLCNESSAMIQNKAPPKLGDLISFFIPCTFSKTFSCNALADLGASINLMPYSLYAKLSLKTLKPTKISVRLADRSFQYPIGIAENMLVEVGKFTFLVDFVILEIRKTFSPYCRCSHSNFDVLLDERSEILHSIEENILEEKLFAEFDEFMAMNIEENSECMLAIFHDMIEESVEVFIDDFSIFENSFDNCLHNLDKMLQRCKDANLVLNREKCHFMVKEGIVLGHKVSGAGLEVDKAKIDVISKLPPLLMSKALEVFWDMPISTNVSLKTSQKLPVL
ncbi:reverse transcriptase domain-containing protein [Tanacetum coccineum]